MTFVLVSVVLETAANRKSTARAQAPLAIGEPCSRLPQGDFLACFLPSMSLCLL